MPQILRTVVLISIAPHIVLRRGNSHILGYVDTFPSRTVEAGIKYRS
ncbi:MAG: hypothetical protein OXC19_15855 [Bryobacterales bacterium]|nr:hypothetical protein [Bryobacterales bacterium]